MQIKGLLAGFIWNFGPDEVITIMDGVKEKLNTEEECLPAPLNLVLRPGTHPAM